MAEHYRHQSQPIQSSMKERSANSKDEYETRSATTTASAIDDYTDTDEEVDFLRYTVPKQLGILEQYQRGQTNAYITATNDLDLDLDLDLDYQQRHNALEQFDQMSVDLPWNSDVYTTDKEENEEIQELKSTGVPVLYHKGSESSTSTKNDRHSLMKEIQIEIERIPFYLTKQNESFQQVINHIRSTATTINNKEGLRKIAILIYKIMVIQTYRLLWTAYLKSGLGQLMIPTTEQPSSYLTTTPIWPKEIKALLQLTNNTNKTKANEIYLKLVNKHLHELDYQLNKYQTELNIITSSFHGYTLEIQQLFQTYIEQNLQSFRMEIEHQIELVHYDYHIRVLKLEYLRHNPNPDQKQLMKEICQNKYEQETTEQEYHLLKYQIDYYNSPSQSFERSTIAQSTLIDSIQNPDIRQELFNQYKAVAEQSRVDLFHLYLKTAENQKDEYKKKYEDGMKKICSDHQSSDVHRKMPSIMIHLIGQRCEKISERIKCHYKFKAQSILPQSAN